MGFNSVIYFINLDTTFYVQNLNDNKKQCKLNWANFRQWVKKESNIFICKIEYGTIITVLLVTWCCGCALRQGTVSTLS